MDGVSGVETDVDEHSATVTFDDEQASTGDLKKALAADDFMVQKVEILSVADDPDGGM